MVCRVDEGYLLDVACHESMPTNRCRHPALATAYPEENPNPTDRTAAYKAAGVMGIRQLPLVRSAVNVSSPELRHVVGDNRILHRVFESWITNIEAAVVPCIEAMQQALRLLTSQVIVLMIEPFELKWPIRRVWAVGEHVR